MSSENPDPNTPQPPPPSPLEGVRWRPLRPEDLFRKEPPPNVDAEEPPNRPAVRDRRQELEHYVKDRPADIDAYLELAALYREAGRSVEAVRVLKMALQVEPQHTEVLWQLEEASLARSLQQWKDVREVTAKLKTAEAQYELERAHTDWAHRRIEVCRARLGRNPHQGSLWLILAQALRDLEKNDEAVEALQPILGDEELACQAYCLLGNCQVALGNDLAALSAFRHAALRREVPAPADIRAAAMKGAITITQRLGLPQSQSLYQQVLQQAEAEQQS